MYIAYSEDKLFKDIGTTKQLFFDNDVIASVKNVTCRQHSPRKHPDNPLIGHDKPWEVIPYIRNGDFDVCMDPADGLFKCWYTDFYGFFASDKRKHRLDKLVSRYCYAQSEDGLRWEKPLLGKHFVDGHDTNTVFFHPPYQLVICEVPSKSV